MNKNCGIYIIECVENNKVYIGASKKITARFGQHRYLLRRNQGKNTNFQKDFNKYGESKFKFYRLESCYEEELHAKEVEYISKYKQTHEIYNMSTGGRERVKFNEEFKKKARELRHSEKTKDYLRIINTGECNPMFEKEPWNKGMKMSKEHKMKLSELKQGAKNNRYGIKHTEKTKEKMRKSAKKTPITSEMVKDKKRGMRRKDWVEKWNVSQRIWYYI